MKKLTMILVSLLALCASESCADNDKIIQMSQLPTIAQEFIKTYFESPNVAVVKQENNGLSRSYEVVFTNGDNIEFDRKGNWKEIECKNSCVPSAIIHKHIIDYIKSSYPTAVVKKIDRDKRGYELELSNGIELSFDLMYNLIDIDA